MPVCLRNVSLHHVAAMTFMTRNGMAYLPHNLPVLDTLGKNFASYKVFYLENDSDDGSGSYLNRWSINRPFVRVAFDRRVESSYRLCPVGVYNCVPRFRLLASLRQRLWRAVRAWKDWTVWISIDFDFVQLNLEQLMESVHFGHATASGAVFSLSLFQRHRGGLGVYEGSHTDKISHAVVCPQSVTSGFGGVAVYFSRIRSLPALDYDNTTKTYEHAHFHSNILNNGMKLFINTRCRPLYRWGSSEYWERKKDGRSALAKT
jgi:hypothetical protein